MLKKNEKAEAIRMRREGKTYNEILDAVHVAKSTLSLWLRSVDLSKPQVHRITRLKREAQKRATQSRIDRRLSEVDIYGKKGRKDVGTLSARELWLVGTALHWAEGSKQNKRSPSTGVVFGNMDHKMLFVFLRWLEALGVKENDIVLNLYVHNDRFSEVPVFITWWSKALSIPESRIEKVYRKNGKTETKRTNTKDLYHGLIRIKVKSSTTLNRQIQGWFEALYSSLKK